MATPLYLLDASIFIFRAYFTHPGRYGSAGPGELHAVAGYLNFVLGWMTKCRPDYALVGFDESLQSGWRHQHYPPYKANRVLPDEALAFQLACCKDLTGMLGLPLLADPLFEADDILASAGIVAQQHNRPVVVISRDKDLVQILKSDADRWWDGQHDCLSAVQWHQRHGLQCHQMADYLSLVGDSVDNIPGVAGVGAVSAKLLLSYFNDLEEVYANLDKVVGLPVRGAVRLALRLREGREEAFMFRSLCQLSGDAPVPRAMRDYRCQPIDTRSLELSLDIWGFPASYWRRLVQRFPTLLQTGAEDSH